MDKNITPNNFEIGELSPVSLLNLSLHVGTFGL